MDFSLSPEQAALQASARRFAREQMAPVAREIEASGEPLSAAWMQRYAELGFLGINVDPAYGGLGLGNLEALLVLEEFAKVSPAIAFPIFDNSLALEMLCFLGDDAPQGVAAVREKKAPDFPSARVDS